MNSAHEGDALDGKIKSDIYSQFLTIEERSFDRYERKKVFTVIQQTP